MSSSANVLQSKNIYMFTSQRLSGRVLLVCVLVGIFKGENSFSSPHLCLFVGTVWLFILNDLCCSFVYL